MQVASAVLALVQEVQEEQEELASHLHHLETLQHLVWERLNTGHWAKVVASPLGRNTHWVGLGWAGLVREVKTLFSWGQQTFFGG